MSQARLPRMHVLGVGVEAIEPQAAVERILNWAAAGRSRYVCLCNAHSIVTACRDPGLARALWLSDLALPDGAPVAWRLRTLGATGQPRVSGPDLVLPLCTGAAAAALPVFLLGGTAETLARLAARLRESVPNLLIAGALAPPFRALSGAEEDAIVAAINRSGARLVLVGLGCPKQERWMAAHRTDVHAVMVGVGAAFDFVAGTVARAPLWMQRAGLEWLHRLALEPRRLWRRYFVTNTLFVAYLAGELWNVRTRTAR